VGKRQRKLPAHYFKLVGLACLLLSTSLLVQAKTESRGPPNSAYVAIIIDDLGHNYTLGLRAVHLPASLTYAILPYSTYAKRLADTAYESGKEVMVHLPMQNLRNMPIGPGGLTSELSRRELQQAVSRAIFRVPHAAGINNHMGSYLTRESLPMEWLMEEIKLMQLFFVDSRTTPDTVASIVAKKKNLLSSSRDIFLDNERSIYAIDRQFRKLVNLAKRQGSGIAIGHPHEETLAYLEIAIPRLQEEGIEIIPASNLIALRQIYNLQLANVAVTGSAVTGSE
jgi:uncharacterized protein